MKDPFGYLADWLRDWLAGARTSEIARALDLIGQELQRRGFTLTWTMTPPLTKDRSTN
jgi:hypothetical protein